MRLTDKNYKNTCLPNNKEYIKLGEHEDIEDELGIDLVTFIKIIKKFSSTKENDDIYVKYFDGSIELVNVVFPRIDLENKRIIDEYDAINNEPYYYYFSEYRKSWALAKEELE